MLDNVTDVADKAINQIDKAILSDQEREQMLTERQKIDMTSPFKLPQLIRPIITIITEVTWVISIIWTLIIATKLVMTHGIETASSMILDSNSIILYVLGATTSAKGLCNGFYFNSRKYEKINAKKVEAAIKIEETKNKLAADREKMEIKEDKKQSRQERRQAKREARNNE